jgi:hypothetical protein
MKRFLCVSILLIGMGCAPSLPTRQPAQVEVGCIQKFKPIFKSDLYNASIDVMGHHISGLVLFKAMPDSSLRVVFTNEAGVKFFDFGFEANGKITTHQVIKKLNKKIVVRTLQSDFGLMLMTKVGKEIPLAFREGENLKFIFTKNQEADCVVTDAMCITLIRLEKGRDDKPNAIVQLFGGGLHAPDSILIKHLNFKMNIALKYLAR